MSSNRHYTTNLSVIAFPAFSATKPRLLSVRPGQAASRLFTLKDSPRATLLTFWRLYRAKNSPRHPTTVGHRRAWAQAPLEHTADRSLCLRCEAPMAGDTTGRHSR